MAESNKITKSMIREVAALASARPNRLIVMPWDDKWRVKKSRAKKAMGIYSTEAEAINVAENEVFSGRVDYGVVFDKHFMIVKEINR
jgi:uncharacterized protein DUF2188